MTISTLLIRAVRTTHVLHGPCIWPSSPRVLRTSVVRASNWVNCKEITPPPPQNQLSAYCWSFSIFLEKKKSILVPPILSARIESSGELMVKVFFFSNFWGAQTSLCRLQPELSIRGAEQKDFTFKNENSMSLDEHWFMFTWQKRNKRGINTFSQTWKTGHLFSIVAMLLSFFFSYNFENDHEIPTFLSES